MCCYWLVFLCNVMLEQIKMQGNQYNQVKNIRLVLFQQYLLYILFSSGHSQSRKLLSKQIKPRTKRYCGGVSVACYEIGQQLDCYAFASATDGVRSYTYFRDTCTEYFDYPFNGRVIPRLRTWDRKPISENDVIST